MARRLLLDTHVAIGWDAGDPLSRDAMQAIADADEVFVSAASAWEIAIKLALGKVSTSRSLATLAAASGFVELPVLMPHAEAVAALPALHRDPFDRLLVAQAQVERLTLVTRNPVVQRYAVHTLGA